jgi:hypothetical protein
MELVSLGCHQRNAAEVATHNLKAHFLSVLVGVANNFPPSLWDQLLPQTEITINLIQQSNATPNVLGIHSPKRTVQLQQNAARPDEM